MSPPSFEAARGFLAEVSAIKDREKYFARFEEAAREGKHDLMVEVVELLNSQSHGFPIAAGMERSTLDLILRTLALTPHPGNAVTCLRIAKRLPEEIGSGVVMPRPIFARIANLLVRGQTRETYLAQLENRRQWLGLETLFAAWTQELVIRGNDFRGVESVERFWQELSGSRHPLARLPLVGVPTEVRLREYTGEVSVRGGSHRMPFGPLESGLTSLEGASKWSTTKEVTTPEVSHWIRSAVDSWHSDSNGVVEVREFEGSFAVDERELGPKELISLGLECLNGASLDTVHVESIDAGTALAILFCASAHGGAYTGGRDGAYGRLEAWTSLASLCGVRGSLDIPATSAIAESSGWVQFSADSKWFQQVAWDIGIACLRPDGRSIAVLAATDTD